MPCRGRTEARPWHKASTARTGGRAQASQVPAGLSLGGFSAPETSKVCRFHGTKNATHPQDVCVRSLSQELQGRSEGALGAALAAAPRHPKAPKLSFKEYERKRPHFFKKSASPGPYVYLALEDAL